MPESTTPSFSLNAAELVNLRDAELDAIFRRAGHLGLDRMVNTGRHSEDLERRWIFNDANWKGFLPKGLPLGEMAAHLFTGYYKRFWKEGERYLGETGYLDGRIPLRHSLEEIVLDRRQNDLDPGRYVLLHYLDPPFNELYYDIMKLAGEDVLLYRGYTGKFPDGRRGWTAPLLRAYGFGQMSVEDFARLYAIGSVPEPEELEGVWRLDAIANANHAEVAQIHFERQPDGRLACRCEPPHAGPSALPPFLAGHFDLYDAAPFHTEMRKLDADCMAGKWVADLPAGWADWIPSGSLGLLQIAEAAAGQKQFGFYYLLTRVHAEALPPEGDGLLGEEVRAERARGAETPDYFSTRPTAELQTLMRETQTRPLETLLNTGRVSVDFEKRRIFRDSFWKGSFATDTLLGWEERLRTSAFGGDAQTAGATFAGGSFWKRFDAIEDGVATGHVVNYELHLLPGKPVVRQMPYPDGARKYVRRGDPILLLNYTNDPYRLVYDTVKVIDEQNAIGVMHLGEFPNGLEFASFVMARHNYPYEKMAADDVDMLFSHPQTRPPAVSELEGPWTGYPALLRQADISLANQANLPLLQVSFQGQGDGTRAEIRIAGGPPLQRMLDAGAISTTLRRVDEKTLVGRISAGGFAPEAFAGLRDCLRGAAGGLELCFVLTRP